MTLAFASMTKPVAAVAAMLLVEECVLRLDDPVDAYLPELADRRVVLGPHTSLDRTVPADRPRRRARLRNRRVSGHRGLIGAQDR